MKKVIFYLQILVILLLIVGSVGFRYWQVKTSLYEITGEKPTRSKVFWYMFVWG